MKLKYIWEQPTRVRVIWKSEKTNIESWNIFDCSEKNAKDYLERYPWNFLEIVPNANFFEKYAGFWNFLAIVVTITLTIIGWIYFQSPVVSSNNQILNLSQLEIEKDAKAITKSIIISWWEGPWDYIGYLSRITGFYSRHKDIYSVEYETYKKQLQFWEEYFNKARSEDKFIYSSDWVELKGLVTSGRDGLDNIYSEKK